MFLHDDWTTTDDNVKHLFKSELERTDVATHIACKVCAINSFLPHNNLVTVAWLLHADGFWPAATVLPFQ